MKKLPTYRPCVVAVIRSADNLFLVGERGDAPGSWQFPQGGIDAGETREIALKREVFEEVGLRDFHIEKSVDQSFTYDYPEAIRLGKKHLGQEQWWYLCTAEKNFKFISDEFLQIAWKSPEEIFDGIIFWKKETYKKALKALGVLA